MLKRRELAELVSIGASEHIYGPGGSHRSRTNNQLDYFVLLVLFKLLVLTLFFRKYLVNPL